MKLDQVNRIENLRKYGRSPFNIAVIHGGPGAGGEMAPVARELSSVWGVLEPIQTATSFEGQIDELKTTIKKNGDFPITLIGFSWGAWLSFIFAANYPALVKKVILIESGPYEEKYVSRIQETRLNRLSKEDRTKLQSIIEILNNPTAEKKNIAFVQFEALFLKTIPINFDTGKVKSKIIFIFVLLGLACVLTYYFHVVLKTGAVFTHFFYIPIILSAIWWKKKGLVVAVFLASLLIFSHIFLKINRLTVNDYLRALIFIFISLVVAGLSEHIAMAEKQSKLAYIELNQIFNATGNGMRVIDKDFNVLKINDTFSNISYIGKNEAIGKKCYELLSSSRCHKSRCPLTQILLGENCSSQLLKIQEQERKRIARELHDGIGQLLNIIKYSVENALNHKGKERISSVFKTLRTINPIIQNSIEEIRRICMDLRPPILDDLGILAAISYFCQKFQTIYPEIHIEKEVNIHEDVIPETLKTDIYRIIQEAFNNIAKYSKANIVYLFLKNKEGVIELKIEDNGLGFDLETAFSKENSNKGFGLTSMKERTELSGGCFSIESSNGNGTSVQASWPCKEKSSFQNRSS